MAHKRNHPNDPKRQDRIEYVEWRKEKAARIKAQRAYDLEAKRQAYERSVTHE